MHRRADALGRQSHGKFERHVEHAARAMRLEAARGDRVLAVDDHAGKRESLRPVRAGRGEGDPVAVRDLLEIHDVESMIPSQVEDPLLLPHALSAWWSARFAKRDA